MTAFYTTKGVGHGTGLGMSISNKIIQGHAGELQLLDSVELGGACVRMILPSVQMNASQEKSGYTVDGSGETADESATDYLMRFNFGWRAHVDQEAASQKPKSDRVPGGR